MNKLVGYIELSEEDNLHFCIPVYRKGAQLTTAVLKKESNTIASFRPIFNQKYREIDFEGNFQVGSPYLYICSHQGKFYVNEYLEMAANLTLIDHLELLNNIEKYELYSFLNLYHETKESAKKYAEELNLSIINVDSFTLPKLQIVDLETAWEAIMFYGDLLLHCQNSLPLDKILKVHSDGVLCLGNYLIETKIVYELYVRHGHLKRDYNHDLLIYIAHFSKLDDEFGNDEHYRIYKHFEISMNPSNPSQHNLILARNSQSEIFALDENAVLLSHQVDMELFEENNKNEELENESVDIKKILVVEDMAKSVLEYSNLDLITDEL